jgi:hypothetical protein
VDRHRVGLAWVIVVSFQAAPEYQIGEKTPAFARQAQQNHRFWAWLSPACEY